MNFQKIEQLLYRLTQCGIPACEVAISYHGNLVYRDAVGYSDVEGKKRVSDKDLYWIFSATKLVTCVAAMQLVERGKIKLDDPVSRYIPSFSDFCVLHSNGDVVRCQNKMNILSLFTMTAGLGYHLEDPFIAKAAQNPNAGTIDIVSAMAFSPLHFEPGTHYRYSFCHDVLAGVVEVASGIPFGVYLQKNIFDPLGMTDIGFHPTEEQQHRFSALYKYNNAEARAEAVPLKNAFALTPTYESGGAGLFSSVDSYIKFLSVLSQRGLASNGYRLLREESVAQFQINRLSGAAWNDFVKTRFYGYGFGLCGRVHVNPNYSMSNSPIGEFGWDGAAGAFAMVDPYHEVALYFAMHVLGCEYAYHCIHPLLRNDTYEALNLI